MPADELYDVTWGNVRLWCSRLETDNSRTVVVHELADGDEHPTQDRGLGPRRVRCDLLFDEMPAERQGALERFRIFKAQVDGGEEELLTHPIDGAYLAKVGEFRYVIDEDSNITEASCEFIKSGEDRPVVAAGAGTSAGAGEDAVTARAEELTSTLDAVGITSTIPADATAAAASWAEASETPTRQVIVDTAAMSDALSELIETERLEDDLALFETYRATIMLGATFRAAALAATAEVASVFRVRIASPVSLLALCARVYGGAEAEDRARQVAGLNDIRRQAWLDPGTELLLPSKSVRRRVAA